LLRQGPATDPEATVTTNLFTAGRDHGPLPTTPACPTCVGPRLFRPAPARERMSITSPEAAVDVIAPLLRDRDREHCVAALLDTKHRLIDVPTISVGSIDHTFMSPREVFRDALLANASAVVVAHNHPSGDPEPSIDDEKITKRLVAAGQVVGIDVLDHVVIAGGAWVSLARRGQV
jgi:DNA repair protein RadC